MSSGPSWRCHSLAHLEHAWRECTILTLFMHARGAFPFRACENQLHVRAMAVSPSSLRPAVLGTETNSRASPGAIAIRRYQGGLKRVLELRRALRPAGAWIAGPGTSADVALGLSLGAPVGVGIGPVTGELAARYGQARPPIASGSSICHTRSAGWDYDPWAGFGFSRITRRRGRPRTDGWRAGVLAERPLIVSLSRRSAGDAPTSTDLCGFIFVLVLDHCYRSARTAELCRPIWQCAGHGCRYWRTAGWQWADSVGMRSR